MNDHLRLLIVEDSEADAFLIARELRRGGYAPEYRRVETEADFAAALDAQDWDVIIADYSLPRFSAPHALRVSKARGIDVPFIIVSGTITEETAVAAMKAGAHDFVTKDSLARLVPAVEREVRDAGVRRERQRAEAALGESEARFAAIVNSALDAIITIDAAQCVVSFNAAAERMFGYSAAQIAGQPVAKLLSPRGDRMGAEPLRDLDAWLRQRPGAGALGSVLAVRADGAEFPVEASISCIELGGRKLYTAILRDISERRRHEEERERLLREKLLLLESTGEGIYGIDLHGHITFVNQAAARMLGYRPEELLGQHSHDLFHKRHPDGSPYPVEECPVYKACRRGERCRVDGEVFWRRDGTPMTVEYSAHPIFDVEAIVGAVVTFNDITERKRAEETLRFQAHLLNTVGQAVIATDLKGTITYWNRHAEVLYGWLAREALGRNVTELTVPDISRQQRAEILATLHAGRTWSGEFLVHRRGGATFTALVTDTPVYDINGNLIGIIGTSIDVTERKRAENELRESREALRALAAQLQSIREEERKRIARDMHDELGQALTGFKMDLAWMRARLQKDDPLERQPLLDKIDAAGAMIDETSGTIRRLCAELRPGVLDDLGLRAAVEWQAREFTRRTAIRCDVVSDEGELDLTSDQSTAVFRIFQEILTNVARHAGATRVNVKLRVAGGVLMLDARDDGRGINPDEMAGARSLGLLGMRERAIAIGGELQIRPASGGGTTVALTVPLNKAPKN